MCVCALVIAVIVLVHIVMSVWLASSLNYEVLIVKCCILPAPLRLHTGIKHNVVCAVRHIVLNTKAANLFIKLVH